MGVTATLKKYIKAAFVFTILIVFIPIAGFAFYSGNAFIKNSEKIQAIIRSADYEDRYPSVTVKKYIRLSGGSNEIPSWEVARLLASKFGYAKNVSTIAWQLNWASWYLAVKTMINEADMYSLFCILSYNGEDHGLNKLSNRLFGKPLNELPEESIAKIMAYEKAPSYFYKHPDLLNINSEKLIERAKNI